ncbi:MAG: hypothetical protein DRI56_02935 [Chloroflexota bacterium]|nr:MAG: hypothetical protein DRI56_02935 [Chloroflexota bacterium]
MRNALERASQWPLATFHPWRRESIRRLAALKDIHKGERCFIIGNGPSLKNTDISKLKDEYTFGMNRIYLAFPDWGFQTSYLASVNSLVIEQCYKDFQQLEIPKFFSWRSRDLLYPDGGEPDAHTHFLHTSYEGPKFAQDAAGRLWEGATVTYVCLQLAFHMGFEKAILIGVDHSFATKGKANKTIVSQGDDPNHFSAKYFGKGFKWQLPDLDTSELAYLRARQAYENVGRQVIDATVGGKLTIFPKVEYDTLFE